MKNPQEDRGISASMLEFMQSQSLTYALKQLDASFSLKLIYLGTSSLVSSENLRLLSAKEEDKFLVREVNLLLDNVPVVRGKSTCIATSDFWRDYLDIFNNSLGEKLFDSEFGVKLKSNSISRSEFFWNYKQPSLNSLINNQDKSKNWSRKSVFDYQGEKLVLEEMFLLDLKNFFK